MPVAKRWSDFSLNFTAHPNTGKLTMKTDAEAVINSVRHLLLTNFYEKPMHPEIGSNITRQLFEPMTYATALRIRDSITETINNFEPRVSLKEVLVDPQEGQNAYRVGLTFYIVNEEEERKAVFLLERNR